MIDMKKLMPMEDILKGTGWKIRDTIDSDNSAYIAVIERPNKTCSTKTISVLLPVLRGSQ